MIHWFLYTKMPISLLFWHFIGDFPLQALPFGGWMSLNKHKNLLALTLHVSIYSACFIWYGPTFVMLTWLTHLLTDAVTSQLTARLWFVPLHPIDELHDIAVNEYSRLILVDKWTYFARLDKRKRSWFFIVIGFDQLIHFVTLTWTYWYLLRS